METKVKNSLLKLFTLLFIICFSYLTLVSIFSKSFIYFDLNAFIIILGVLFLLILLYFIDRKLIDFSDKTLKYMAGFFFIMLFAFQCIFIILFPFTPSWDYGVVVSSAIQFVSDSSVLPSYFYNFFPNNIGLTLLLGYIFKIASIFTTNSYTLIKIGIIFNLFMINLAVFVTFKLIAKVFSLRKGVLFSIFILFVTPFYSYSRVIYTDTITMFFPIAMFYFLYLYTKSESKYRFKYVVYIGILGALGTMLKTNIIIALIGILIYLIFSESFKNNCKSVPVLLVVFIFLMGMYKTVASSLMPIPYEEAGLPFTHWVMMGMNNDGPGGWNEEDAIFSTSYKVDNGKAATQKENIRIMKERLNTMGFKGYMTFLNRKVNFTWSDGTYFAPTKLRRQLTQEYKLQTYVIGDKAKPFTYFSQFSHTLILLTILIGAILSFAKPREFIRGIYISLFGVFLFLLLWETRSRYLVCYLPTMIFASFYGLNSIFDFINNKLTERNFSNKSD